MLTACTSHASAIARRARRRGHDVPGWVGPRAKADAPSTVHIAVMTTRHFTYVLALLFSIDRSRVVLMRKTRPAWQAGRVNALGGKLLPGESPVDAARREVREEAGVDVVRWDEFLVWDDPVYRMHAMRAFDDAALRARTAEDQEVFLADVGSLPSELIDNLRWLIPLALDAHVSIPVRVTSANPEGSGLTEPPPPS
jgi:8-oxo-dGTP diphosphatase